MCKRVKTRYEDINFKKPNWFHDFQWTQKQEDNFKEWLTNYLKTNKEAREELMQSPRLKGYIKIANEFLFQYGWKTKQN